MTSALFAVVFIGILAVGDRQHDAVAWLVFVTAFFLMWIPVTVRWVGVARDSSRAFRDGLADR